jgi:hypothetical protein
MTEPLTRGERAALAAWMDGPRSWALLLYRAADQQLVRDELAAAKAKVLKGA